LAGLGPKFLDTGSQPSLNGSPQNLYTVWCGIKAENLLLKIVLPIPNNWAGENLKFTSNIEDHRQSEACNFETAQHIDKQQ